MIELQHPEVQDYFESIGMPVDESEFYLVEEAPSNSYIRQNVGTYFPRTKKGYIEPKGTLEEIEEAYIHEYAHGSFFENTELGSIIVEKDKELSKVERLLFGRIGDEDFKAIPDSELETSRKVGENPKIYRVNPRKLKEYRRKRESLTTVLSTTRPLIEGFSLLIEDELGESGTKLAQAEETHDYLKEIRRSEGIEGVKEFLSNPDKIQTFLIER